MAESKFATELLDQQTRLQAHRSTFEQHWSEVAPYVLPRQDEFFDKNKTPGERRTREKVDDTAVLGLQKFAAAMESVLTPRAQQWHGLQSTKPELEEDFEVQDFYDRLTKGLFKIRYSSNSNFASQMHENYMSLGAFGTGVLIVEDMVGKGIRYKSSHLKEHFFMENVHGRIDINYRKYELTARQAKQKFPDVNIPSVEKCLDKEPHKKLEFLHVVMPDEGNESGGMPFVSYHVSIEDKMMLWIGGYRTFPFIISRYVTSPSEIYGRSPAMSALAEIKMLNSMRRTDIKARHLAVDPPILAADQQTVRRLAMKPGSINYGTLDINGNPLARPYNSGVRIDLSNDGINQSREFINDSFLVTLFQILVDNPAMTATEVLQRSQEKGALLSPTMGRQQSEALGPLIEREISILEQYGTFEDDGPLPMPEKLKEAGGAFEVEYTSPLSVMQKAEEAMNVEKTIQALIPIAQFEPSILQKVDWNEYAEIMRQANGAPARLFRSPEDLQALQEAQAQQQEIQQVVEAAPQVAGAIKNIADAQAVQAG